MSTATRWRVVGVEGHERVVQPLGRVAVDGVADVALVDADDHDAVGQLGFAHGPDRTRPGGTVAGVRVISGSARGRRLVAPEGPATRPTPDRVREATFNALGSLGAVDEAAVLDLFAGSGAMGIEALSRGAARGDLRRLRPGRPPRHRGQPGRPAGSPTRPRWWRRPVERFLAGAQQRRWDLALLDPPYDFDGWPELLLDLPAQIGGAASRAGRSIRPSAGRSCAASATAAPTWSSPAPRRLTVPGGSQDGRQR